MPQPDGSHPTGITIPLAHVFAPAEDIAYGCPGASAAETREAAITANADGFIRQFASGYEKMILQSNLSGGQQQRTGLARALLKKLDLLILDEATSAVDVFSEHEIIKLLTEHRHFRTALVISHRQSTLAACQDGIVISEGQMVEAGPLPAF